MIFAHPSMPRTVQDQFDEDDEEHDVSPDPQGPDPFDLDDRDDAETIPCPYCRKPVYEQAEMCPYCGSYISFEDAPRRYPWWLWAGVILGLIAVVLWVF